MSARARGADVAAERLPDAPLITVVQAWVELVSSDPEAVSALAVTRAHLAAGRRLRSLRRIRLFEIHGPLRSRGEIDALLHRSIQFYNPHKERCTVRASMNDAPPLQNGEVALRVQDRDGDRRGGAERWWHHETGEQVEVREAVVWLLAFEDGVDALDQTIELSLVRGRRHGLFCNPHAQEAAVVRGPVPLPWIQHGAR